VISILVPTYNEVGTVPGLIKRVDEVLAGIEYEIVFVDDDSPDGTAAKVNSFRGEFPVRAVVRTEGIKGLAPAIVDGLEHVTGETVVVMDADLQHPPEAIPALVDEINGGNDIVVASRYVPGGEVPGLSAFRKLVSKGATLLANMMLPRSRSINDPMSGFFAFKREVVRDRSLNPIGFKILLEILILGKYERSKEVPIAFSPRDRGESKLNFRQQIEYVKHLLSLMRRNGELSRFFKFCLVGFSGVIVNLGLMWLLTERANLFYVASAAVSIEVSIISNFLFNNYFTFADRRTHTAASLAVRLLRFNAVSLIGLGINLFVIWLLTSVVGIYYLLSNCVGIVLATSWNYLVNNWWTWKWTKPPVTKSN
jgi:dolichol-phosphate mannosyltransferase